MTKIYTEYIQIKIQFWAKSFIFYGMGRLYYGYILYPTSPQKYYAISKRPQSTLGVFCQFYSVFLMLQPHRPSPAMRNLALFKEPAL